MCPWFLVESTAPSPAIGMGSVEYDILDGDGETIRSITRRFTMANVQIRAGLGGDVHCISNVRYATPTISGD